MGLVGIGLEILKIFMSVHEKEISVCKPIKLCMGVNMCVFMHFSPQLPSCPPSLSFGLLRGDVV